MTRIPVYKLARRRSCTVTRRGTAAAAEDCCNACVANRSVIAGCRFQFIAAAAARRHATPLIRDACYLLQSSAGSNAAPLTP